MSQRSHAEFTGRAVRHYDLFMDLLLMGRYQRFIEQAIQRMGLREGDTILDLGSGTGRNVCVMMRLLGPTGQVTGVDSSQEMVRRAQQRCSPYPNVAFLKRRIEEPLPFYEAFDKVCIVFTLHSLEDEDKERVLANVRHALKPTGILWILDFNEFDLERQSFPFRWVFRWIECDLGIEFLSLDLEAMVASHGLGKFVAYPFLGGYVRLLGAQKLEMGGDQMANERIKELEDQIADLESRWPAHSVPPAMLQQLEELEAELERELKKANMERGNAQGSRGDWQQGGAAS